MAMIAFFTDAKMYETKTFLSLEKNKRVTGQLFKKVQSFLSFLSTFSKKFRFTSTNNAGCSDRFTVMVIDVPSSKVACPSITRLAGFELSSFTSRRRSLLMKWGRDESR